ncbi:MAG: metallophosphoesterase, partial [Ruminococcus sp.]|nr:metallophosphoesterase [Candidatus Copronaster equi]
GSVKGDGVLRFNNDGNFTIIHLTDSHLQFPLEPAIKQYIIEAFDAVKPDLVVLGGDIITESCVPNEFSENPLKSAIEELCGIFTQRNIYFTITFGNHDRQFGKDGETLMSYYSEYGGKYFLGYDADPELYGCGTHDLQILSSNSDKVAYNLFMIDSGDSVFDENGNRLGYDSVRPDQINWYKNRVETLKAENGGEVVPSMIFQHIIVQEIDDYVFYNVKHSAGKLGEDFDGRHYLFTPIPKIHNVKSGFVMEKPCPGYYNFGQLDAMKEMGDVVAVFSGHDHSNTFTVNIDGIDVVNSGGCKKQASMRLFTSGVRVIKLNEKHPRNYESEMLSITQLGKKDGSQILSYGYFPKIDIFITNIWDKAVNFVMSIVHLFK